jgi:AraC-like DNA-binding protein
MGKQQCANAPNMKVWEDAGCSFVRFDLSQGAKIEIDKTFHDSIVFLAFERCRWRSTMGGVNRNEAPGSVVVRDAGQVFSLKSDSVEVGAVCREIHIPTARLAEIYDACDNPLPALEFATPLLENDRLANALFRAHHLFERKECELERSVCLAQLFQAVAFATSGKRLDHAFKTCSKRNAVVVSYLRENFHKQISLQELAAVVEMNPFVLIRQFQKEVGLSPHEYLQIHRVNQAKRHIRLGERLADVAQICGFSDQSHLTRQFKRRTGLTPGNFLDPRRFAADADGPRALSFGKRNAGF